MKQNTRNISNETLRVLFFKRDQEVKLGTNAPARSLRGSRIWNLPVSKLAPVLEIGELRPLHPFFSLWTVRLLREKGNLV